jgi:hypothetical protein
VNGIGDLASEDHDAAANGAPPQASHDRTRPSGLRRVPGPVPVTQLRLPAGHRDLDPADEDRIGEGRHFERIAVPDDNVRVLAGFEGTIESN